MATDSWQTISDFLAVGNLKTAAPAQQMTPDRKSDLRAKLDKLRAGNVPAPQPSDTPSDFTKAVRDREAARKAEQENPNTSKGRDIPRIVSSNPAFKGVMSRVYKTHDFIVGLPSPGGLGAILLVIVVLFFILIPATSAGETRAMLLWEVLFGKKQLPQEQIAVDSGSGAIVTPGDIKAIAGAVGAGIGVGIQSGLGLLSDTSGQSNQQGVVNGRPVPSASQRAAAVWHLPDDPDVLGAMPMVGGGL